MNNAQDRRHLHPSVLRFRYQGRLISTLPGAKPLIALLVLFPEMHIGLGLRPGQHRKPIQEEVSLRIRSMPVGSWKASRCEMLSCCLTLAD